MRRRTHLDLCMGAAYTRTSRAMLPRLWTTALPFRVKAAVTRSEAATGSTQLKPCPAINAAGLRVDVANSESNEAGTGGE